MGTYEASMITSVSPQSDADKKQKQLDATSDSAVKRILCLKEVTARILKWTVPQFADLDVETIIRDHIEGEIDAYAPVSAYQKSHIVALDTESSEPNEATIHFDVKCRVRLSEGKTANCFLVVDMEGQKDFSPGYSLARRAEYYCSRLISEQLPVIGKDEKYDALSKVLSIWICFEPPQEYTNAITKISMTQKSIVGDFKFPEVDIDLMESVFILLGPDDSTECTEILEFLDILFSPTFKANEKLGLLHKKFDFPITDEITEEVSKMTNAMNRTYGFRTQQAVDEAVKAAGFRAEKAVSLAVEEAEKRSLAEGRAEGLAEGERKTENLLSALCTWVREKFGAEKALDVVVNKNERKVYQTQFENSPEYEALMKAHGLGDQ